MDERAASPRWALDYPYEQPQRSYLQLGERTLELPPEGPDLAGREPLLAYGANASPLALTRKLAGLPPAPLPMLRARLAGFDVVFSNHVSPYGAVPGTLHPSPGTTVAVFAAYPDGEQLRALTMTEPNYELARLSGLDCRREDGVRLDRLDAYLSRHGPRLLDGAPLALAEIEASGRCLAALTQREIQARIA
jgi:hypothetical protein